jgi:glycosyltransferase involved in cell wall biosynthesis
LIEGKNNNSLKIKHFVFLVNNYSVFGGAERQAFILAIFLKKNLNAKVSFLSYEKEGVFRDMLISENIETYYLSFKHNSRFLNKTIDYIKIILLLRRIKSDVLIPYVYESNKIVAQIWKYTGATFAFWNQRDEGRNLYGTSREKKLIRNVSSIVSNSFEGKNALIRIEDVSPESVIVINNGIIPHLGEIIKSDWYEIFSISRNRPLISMIANITSRKDHKTLLKAWRLVINYYKDKNLDLPFLILGGRKSETYNSLRLLAFDLNLSDHIGFTGHLDFVQNLISQSDLCVFSSKLEGCPNGVLECMEQGKAVIGTDISGIHQALGDKYKDFTIVEKDNAEMFSKKIIHLLSNKELKLEIGAYNKQRISSEFSVEGMVSKYLSLIND